MKLSKPLEEKVKEEIWQEITKRLGEHDIDVNEKTVTVAGAVVKIDLFIDLDMEA